MKKMSKFALVLALLLSLALLTTAVAEDYTGKVLRVAWWGGDARHEATTKLVDEFAKQYPGLKVEVEYCGWNDYFTRLNTQAAGNDLPDVMQFTWDQIPSYARNNQLLALDQYITAGTLDMSAVDPAILASGTTDGVVYGIPTGINAPCMVYNAKALEEAGVTLSIAPTVSEYVEACRAVYEKTGMKSSMFLNEIFYRSRGGDKWAADGKSVGFDLETLTQFWGYKLQGVTEGYQLAPDDHSESSDDANLANGILWSVSSHTNFLSSLESKSGLELSIMCHPVADDAVEKNPTYTQPNMLWCASANSEMPEIAAAFISYYINEETTYDLCGTDRGVPITAEMRNYVAQKATTADQKISDFLNYLTDGHSTGFNTTSPDAQTEALAAYTENYEYVNYKAVTAEEIPALAEETINRMNALLAK